MKTSLSLFSLLFLSFFVACSDKDYYDPQAQAVPEELSDLKVPAGFDWTTSSQFTLNVDVDDQYNNTSFYKVQVFDKNPIISDDALLLAEGLAKGNQPFVSKVTYSKADSTLYIQETSPSGKRSVRSIYVSNADAGIISTTKSAATTKTSVNLEYTRPTIAYSTPANAIAITGSSPYYIRANNVSYVIPAGQTFEGEIINDYFYDVFVYVEGTWKNTGTQTSLNKMKLIVQNGGKYLPTQATSTINVNDASKIVVASSGAFNSDKKTVNISVNNENSQLINNSSVFYVNNISNVKELYNYGTMVVSGTVSSNSQNVKIINESSLTAQNLTLNGGNIINTCKFIVNETTTLENNVTINVAADKLFKSKVLAIGSTSTIALDSHSILDVSEELQFKNTGSSIKGPDAGEKALLRLEKIAINSWTRPTFSGYLQIESSNYPANKAETSYNLPQDSKYIDFVRKGESTLVIASTDCNGGGNTPKSTTPNDESYPLNVVLGTTYTYGFEDNYPSIGDYDMNDLILDANLGYTLSEANKVSKLTIRTKVRAVGATKRLAAGIQLDGIVKENIKSVTNSNTSFKGDVFSIANGLESNQDYAVIPLTDDAHALFGATTSQFINTKTGESYIPAKEITLEVTFNQPIDISNISLFDMLNIFVINGGYNSSNRMEVHLRGYQPTKKSSDLSSGKNYSSSDFVYAIRVPKSIKYPIEWVRIIDAYPQFKEWVSSMGASKPNWYNVYDNKEVYLLEK